MIDRKGESSESEGAESRKLCSGNHPKKFKVAVGQLFIARLLENSGGKILFTPIPSKWKLLRHAGKHPK
ncbi:hypothetical protein FC14_GL000191 [Ligilactobacillus agilis DSM 20509]|uniref:Uncharacterized protein n=1 Tax=Ligilactobacillus agilis DSM 20509 TaxID=1423718 RepID=A0A0R2AHT2_9LACO|nr:hypothetical protein [Ligilactobacillus agilis]KRM66245.1 hypothetical protein FC14_GL000191 [Ligilactobacillus agilis DSM 20509]